MNNERYNNMSAFMALVTMRDKNSGLVARLLFLVIFLILWFTKNLISGYIRKK